jgi:hypothetical protein
VKQNADLEINRCPTHAGHGRRGVSSGGSNHFAGFHPRDADCAMEQEGASGPLSPHWAGIGLGAYSHRAAARRRDMVRI